MSDHIVMNREAGSVFCRMASTVAGRLVQWGRPKCIAGRAIHEWGTRAGSFVFTSPGGQTP